jgi:hypothetical protein
MLRPGGNVDSWCGTCKMVLAHTIEAMVGDKPARVHCNTCQAQHTYKPNKPGESAAKTPRTRKAAVPGAPKTPRVRATQYQKLLNDKDRSQAKRYSPKEVYAPGDVVEHPNFGVGVTTAIKDGAKIEVLFEAGMKMLVHNR